MRKEEDFRVRIAEAWADVEAARADVEKARTGVEKTKVAALERENEILKSQYKIMRDIFMEYCERKRWTLRRRKQKGEQNVKEKVDLYWD